ncbi:MAG: 30S ribosomal protein S8 [Chloroflexi bacterium]|nr:MAG: 30S ribosomal protein S8 [Chloroflexota bacterium]HDN79355.1 30S ribosomal protein S8 [Chloroflexota bacterium]
MTMTDPIADMLTRIRNALMARHTQVVIPGSKIKVAIARILKDEGYIENFKLTRDRPQPMIIITLKYDENGKPVITGLKRVSKPGRRIYVNRREIPWVLSGMGIAILSTSKGILTDKQARRLGVGGEVLCYVW